MAVASVNGLPTVSRYSHTHTHTYIYIYIYTYITDEYIYIYVINIHDACQKHEIAHDSGKKTPLICSLFYISFHYVNSFMDVMIQ